MSPFIDQPLCHYCGIPCFVERAIEDIYQDPSDLSVYLGRYQQHLRATSIYETQMLDHLKHGSKVVSIGEGTGEFVASLAMKYPQLEFFAFDYTPARSAIAVRLMKQLGVTNVTVYIGSVERLPFANSYFSAVIERGVFHILPRLFKQSNLAEIERTCVGPVILGQMVNARYYLVRRWLQSKLSGNARIWNDAIATFRMIDPTCDTLLKLALFVKQETRHEANVLHYFKGDRETAYPSRHARPFEHLGGVMYRTNA